MKKLTFISGLIFILILLSIVLAAETVNKTYFNYPLEGEHETDVRQDIVGNAAPEDYKTNSEYAEVSADYYYDTLIEEVKKGVPLNDYDANIYENMVSEGLDLGLIDTVIRTKGKYVESTIVEVPTGTESSDIVVSGNSGILTVNQIIAEGDAQREANLAIASGQGVSTGDTCTCPPNC